MTAADHHQHEIVETPRGAQALLTLQLQWDDEDDTQRFAAALARQPQLRDAFITLHGNLGAGKTTLVRHLLRALGVAGRIKSPTYAVVEPHQAPGLDIWHFDFYRFHDPREWEDAGFRDVFASPGLKLAEWPQQAGAALPPADVAICLHANDDASRQATLTAHTPRGRDMLQGLAQPLPDMP
ncbi:tRNA (adenosine(37)-N6)-threonylcarbamoyltransferase complex ATPase subunit type 1 TsaE [Pulveribacter sp.]|uniref:tRNA (adenosine(37)-N6)-threonylcarbamoyltransferase complex ATPase subunit type 1 TsaE n=1 Tax=Pulveribacter sp. TaxID=2678893 RepID=UPI0039173A49